MQDNVSVLIATIVAVVIVVLFPVYNIATRQDSIANNMVVKATTNFVDDVRSKGYIDAKAYENFMAEINNTGNMYDVELEVHRPTFIEISALGSDEYEEDYIIDYTEDVLNDLYPGKDVGIVVDNQNSILENNSITLNEGDKFYVRVKNTNMTQAQVLFQQLIGGSVDSRIVVNHGGTVYASDWEKSDNAEVLAPRISISRPLKYDGTEFEYGYITSVYDQVTDTSEDLFSIKVELSDRIHGQTDIVKFILKYKNIKRLGNTLVDRVNHVKNYVSTLGFGAAVSVSDEKETLTGQDIYSYEYTITLSDIAFDFEINKFIKGRVQILQNSANTESAGGTSLVNSDEFVILYERLYKEPPIPEGFAKSIFDGETEVRDGLVIYKTTAANLEVYKDNKDYVMKRYDQFVWVPCYVEDLELVDWGNSLLRHKGSTYKNCYNQSEIDEYNAIKESVDKYGGFYIARYEAGSESYRVFGTAGTAPKPYGNYSPVIIRKEQNVYKYVGWGISMNTVIGDVIDYHHGSINKGRGAVYLSRDLYPANSSYATHLIYGSQWDAVLKWIQASGFNVKDSRAWGNYSGGEPAKTGQYAAKNIYDLAGNAEEWTMEAYGDNLRVIRGGAHYSTMTNDKSKPAAAFRGGEDPYFTMSYITFRPALYLK